MMPGWDTNSCNNLCGFTTLAESNHVSGFGKLHLQRTIPQQQVDLKADHRAGVLFIKWLSNLSLHPLTHTICSHIFSRLSLCDVWGSSCAELLWLIRVVGEATPFISSCSLWSFLLITGLGWRLILSCAFLRADAQIGISGRRESFASPLLCSWFIHFHQCQVEVICPSGRAVLHKVRWQQRTRGWEYWCSRPWVSVHCFF